MKQSQASKTAASIQNQPSHLSPPNPRYPKENPMRATATTPASNGAPSATATQPRERQTDHATTPRGGASEADLDAVLRESGPEDMALRNKLTVTVPEAAAL